MENPVGQRHQLPHHPATSRLNRAASPCPPRHSRPDPRTATTRKSWYRPADHACPRATLGRISEQPRQRKHENRPSTVSGLDADESWPDRPQKHETVGRNPGKPESPEPGSMHPRRGGAGVFRHRRPGWATRRCRARRRVRAGAPVRIPVGCCRSRQRRRGCLGVLT